MNIFEMLNSDNFLRLIGIGLFFVLIIIIFIGRAISAGKKENLTASKNTGDEVIAAITAAINEYRKYNQGQLVFITLQKTEDNITAAIAAAINEYRKHN